MSTISKSKNFKKNREQIEQAVDRMIGLADQLLKPLSSLSDEQTRAVVALFSLTRSVEQINVTLPDRGKGALDKFRTELGKANSMLANICPVPPTRELSLDPCFQAQMDYGKALAECEKEGKHDDADCPDAWKYTAILLDCAMQKIESMRKEIDIILGGRHGPRPDPWPWRPEFQGRV